MPFSPGDVAVLVWFPLLYGTLGAFLRSFFEELRYRNVFRVGVAYVVASWLIAQVADLIVDAFNLPESFLQMIIILLVLGMPVALFLAWAFELTPDGVKKAKDLPADMPKDPRSGRRLNITIIAALVVAVAWLGWDELRDATTTTDDIVTDKSIAVLPFADFSPDGEQGWFADGLTDEILNALARTSDLRVASRTSSFQYRGADGDLPRIARELSVAHILEGSVRRAGERLRVTAQLIRAADDTHLWSQTFDGTTEDSIEIQEQIALKIANALETAMDPDELERMLSAGTSSIEAWELYLRAIAGQDDTTGAASEVLGLYERAIAIDPLFVDAYLGIAEFWAAHLNPAMSWTFDQPIAREEPHARFDEAIATAAELARSDATRAEHDGLRALVDVRLWDFLDAQRRIVATRPDDLGQRGMLVAAHIFVGDYDGARVAGQEAKALAERVGGRADSVYSILHRVDLPAALEMAETAIKRPNAHPSELYQVHRVFLYAGKVEEAARVMSLYRARENDLSAIAMAEVRQACAEGRTEDADRHYEDSLDHEGELSDNQWLFLKTLGRNDEAVAEVLKLDSAGAVTAVAGFLHYTHFDPTPYPNFMERLEAQSINRPPAQELPFACRR